MEFTEYWAIVEREHSIQNPMSPDKLARLADYCALRDGLDVLDVGCGKAWLLREWAARWMIRGTGVEINPAFLAEARERVASAGADARLRFVEGPAERFTPDASGYDVVLCIGATFALGGLVGALAWMRRALRPSGVLAVGEVYLTRRPLPADVAQAEPWTAELLDLAGTIDLLCSHGLELTGLIAAAPDDWDDYEGRHWSTALRWAAANPEHPDRAEVLDQMRRSRDSYLRWQRESLGWAILIARPA